MKVEKFAPIIHNVPKQYKGYAAFCYHHLGKVNDGADLSWRGLSNDEKMSWKNLHGSHKNSGISIIQSYMATEQNVDKKLALENVLFHLKHKWEITCEDEIKTLQHCILQSLYQI